MKSWKEGLTNALLYSLSYRRGCVVCYWSDLPICDQCPPLRSVVSQNKRYPIRNPLHSPLRHRHLGLLEQYHRRRLAPACRGRIQLIHIFRYCVDLIFLRADFSFSYRFDTYAHLLFFSFQAWRRSISSFLLVPSLSTTNRNFDVVIPHSSGSCFTILLSFFSFPSLF